MGRNSWKAALAKDPPLYEGDMGDQAADPKVKCVFPIPAWSTLSECRHAGPFRPGSPYYCPVCHASGFDRRLASQLAEAKRKAKARPVPPTAKFHPKRGKRKRVAA